VREDTRPGDVLADRYRLTDLLTESEGGRFWRAFDSVLQRDVAVHIIACDDERAPLLRKAARTSATVLDRRMLRVRHICQMLTNMNAPNTITQAPVASPSSPSVRFTALLVPVIITQ